MTPVLLHERSREDVKLGKDETQDRQLEDQPHGERESGESGDIRTDSDGADHSSIYLIGGKEAKGNGKENEIVHYHSKHEKEIAGQTNADRIATFVVVERRADETI